MEALWQGVPVVCFRGDRWVSRTSATLMVSAGLDEFVGESVADYVAISANWSSAERRDELRKLRSGMRTQLAASPACDGDSLARDFERTVLEIIAATD